MSQPVVPVQPYVPRRLGQIIDDALADTRVVVVNGARQCGKTTLLRELIAGTPARWRSLDDEPDRRAAQDDPVAFVRSATLLAIDEIQRVPDLVLSIKSQVDRDNRPGQYLLTGSARLLGLRTLPDSLVGRAETIELWPFSQGEIDGSPDGFIDAVFDAGEGVDVTSDETRDGYASRVVRGGFPAAVARLEPRRRGRFFDRYVRDIVERDVTQLSEIERVAQLSALIKLLAARSGQLLVTASLGNDVGLNRDTAARYLGLLEEVFLIKRIPAWSRNISTRAVGTPKVAMVDSGVAADLIAIDATRLESSSLFGPLLEGFVLMELARQIGWSRDRVELFHYRTRDQVEVDAVLEARDGRVVGVEVKSASTVRSEDFRGLRHLAERVGADFVLGVVLYTGPHTLPFGDRMRAMPVSSLWQTDAG